MFLRKLVFLIRCISEESFWCFRVKRCFRNISFPTGATFQAVVATRPYLLCHFVSARDNNPRRLYRVTFCRQQNTPSDPNTSLLSPQSATSCKSLASSFSGIKSPLSPTTPILSPTSKLVPNPLNPGGLKTPNVLSPNTPNSSTSKSKRRRDRENRKNSQHYQESDILDSYYRSSPADKISDYEDIWNTTDQSNHSTWSPNENTKSSSSKDNNNRIACPTPLDRLRSSNDRLMTAHERIVSPGERSLNERLPGEQMQLLRNDRFILRNDKLSYKETTSPELSSFKPAPELKSPTDQSSPEETGMGRRPDLLSRVCEYTFSRSLTESGNNNERCHRCVTRPSQRFCDRGDASEATINVFLNFP